VPRPMRCNHLVFATAQPNGCRVVLRVVKASISSCWSGVNGQCPSHGWRGRCGGGTRVRFTDNMNSTALGGQYGLRGHTPAITSDTNFKSIDTFSETPTTSHKHPYPQIHRAQVYKLFLPPIIAFGNGSRQLHRHRTCTRQHHVSPVLNGL
jgi:hypothetical protein